jgi:protein phosphatase
MALSAVEPARQNATAGRRPSAEPVPEAEEGGPPVRTAPLPRQGRKRRFRVPGALLAFLAVVAIVAVGAWTASRAVYFIGVDEQTNIVTIYRGLPYELPFGIDLYERWYTSGVALSQVPPARRERFTGHQLRSKDDAEDAVRALERGQIE